MYCTCGTFPRPTKLEGGRAPLCFPSGGCPRPHAVRSGSTADRRHAGPPHLSAPPPAPSDTRLSLSACMLLPCWGGNGLVAPQPRPGRPPPAVATGRGWSPSGGRPPPEKQSRRPIPQRQHHEAWVTHGCWGASRQCPQAYVIRTSVGAVAYGGHGRGTGGGGGPPFCL